MIEIKEITVANIDWYWEEHIKYLVEDEIVTDEEDILYFKSDEYRDVIKNHMIRNQDKHHLIKFIEKECVIGLASFCTYDSEDSKCFILDFWILPEYRNRNKGGLAFKALMEYSKGSYYEINANKENSIRFWKKMGFTENGADEYGEKLFIKK